MRKAVLAVAALAASVLVQSAPANAGPQPFVGEIMIAPYDFCPRGYLPADGRLLQISQNTALFSLILTNYGGDGSSTFALPAMAPIRTVTGAFLHHCIAIEGIFPSRD